MTNPNSMRPVTAETQELRLATAMTGGVSLAIWMGGVARELSLLQRASRRRALCGPSAQAPVTPDAHVEVLYLRLLDLLDMTVDVDVLAGTSAGGINAPLLALARVNDLDLGRLRDMWIKVGSFDGLLRNPEQDKPSSLLQGDAVLLRGIRDGITALWGKTPDTPKDEAPETRVFMTTTLLEGETSRFTDAFGTLVQDVDHHGMFNFDQDDLAARETTDALATAGRSSASYPFAFEPGFVSRSGDGDRPAMAPYSNITRSHWVADGGLLTNRPINPVLQEIFSRSAKRHVRRVLLYVVPSPGENPDPAATPDAARLDSPLALPKALIKDMSAVISQSIAADLRAFREHNDRVDEVVDTRLRLAELATKLVTPAGSAADQASSSRLRTVEMLSDYEVRQSDWMARPLVSALMRAITTLPRDELPATWAAEMGPGRSIEAVCLQAAADRVSAGWQLGSLEPAGAAFSSLASYGPTPFEGAKATLIAMLRAGFILTDAPGVPRGKAPDKRAQLGVALEAVHEALRFRQPNIQKLVSEEVACQAVAERARLILGDGSGSPLDPAASKLQVLTRDVTALYVDALSKTKELANAWQELAEVVVAIRPVLDELAGHPPSLPKLTMSPRDRAAAELKTYLKYLELEPGLNADRIAIALFDLHVATRSVLPAGAQVEQRVELVQLSADSRTLLDPRRTTAADKLTGMQLAHFGAFYKGSWRASDWTWGRIDGAGWLVHLLLDPRRIRTVTERGLPEEQSDGSMATRFLEALCLTVLELPTIPPGQEPTDEVRAELESVFSQDRLPPSLPLTALWLAQTWQRWIAAAELPTVAQQMDETSSRPHPWASDVDAAVRAGEASKAGTSEVFGELLARCPVPDEKLATELGEPLFRKTIAKTIGVGGAMLDGVPRVFPFLGSILTTVRTLTLAVHRAVSASSGRTRLLLGLGVSGVVLGVPAATSNSELLGVTGIAATLTGLALIALVTWGWHTGKAWAAVTGAVVVSAVVLISFPMRDDIFGDGTCTDEACKSSALGWFGRTALPWLSAKPWHVLLVLALIAGLIAAAGAFFGRKRRRARSAVTATVDYLGTVRIRYEFVPRQPPRIQLRVRVSSPDGTTPPQTATVNNLSVTGTGYAITELKINPDVNYSVFWSTVAGEPPVPSEWRQGDVVIEGP